MFSGESGDLIMHDNVVPRRFGFDFLEETFLGRFVEGFGEGFVGVPFSGGGVGRSFFEVVVSARVEVSIFDDVGSSLGDGTTDGLDVTVFVVEVEVA